MKATTKKKRDGSEQVMLGKVIMKEKPARKRARRQEWDFSRELLRVREIEKIIRFRHGSRIPDPSGTDDVDTCLAYLRAVAMTPRSQDVVSWSSKWAPWADPVTVQSIAKLGSGRKWMLKADAVAKLLDVTMSLRTALGLHTIGACDMATAERKDLAKANKRERDKGRQERKRRELGMVDRKSQQAQTLAATKPWEAEGMSRRTWFYRQKRDCTAMSRVEINRNGDTSVQPASQPDFPPAPPQVQIGQSRVAGLSGGLGHHAPAGFQGAAPHGSGDSRDEEAA
ncbi:hypothetical protein N181_09770 [Sinorhizobium fredii USDA 205]|uniref:Uncharacterized protein n=1 Tax=Rhizobium fredii TaxID=380 RepID=A0A844A965_RHIFR|nr:hypothetical protein [Sinorhizobium fredii]KSV90947.1 hypothetical protein N181_09770 [Sinorhizobium fredii USDA 205]MQX08658.1 hypothetical protein [Sinorhizobium fredii]GEC30525.1 hypothetical protein EFR01_06960 [Sinorhizobium fredii]GLS09722.1 hypothetical protein GCM10007864_33530 [Sinorhizobium fredii]